MVRVRRGPASPRPQRCHMVRRAGWIRWGIGVPPNGLRPATAVTTRWKTTAANSGGA